VTEDSFAFESFSNFLLPYVTYNIKTQMNEGKAADLFQFLITKQHKQRTIKLIGILVGLVLIIAGSILFYFSYKEGKREGMFQLEEDKDAPGYYGKYNDDTEGETAIN
jgi:hypothetical protein